MKNVQRWLNSPRFVVNAIMLLMFLIFINIALPNMARTLAAAGFFIGFWVFINLGKWAKTWKDEV